jgi:D-alanine--D-alanine ligase
MRIAVIHTAGSPCRCAEAVEKGLTALGHEAIIFNSEEIQLRAPEIAASCDLTIDHADTYREAGSLRPVIRALLENHGARIVGSDARACFLADNKAVAKNALFDAGIPVPPGLTVNSKNQSIPAWLSPPIVLKPAFEHMSRGLFIAKTMQELHAQLNELLDRFKQPIIIETYIPGRELAVSLLEEDSGIRVLPVLEWLSASETLSEEFKLAERGDKQDARKADLSPELESELKELSIVAFRTLGLRDYARFDVRLSPGGSFYFLEANTTPSLEPLEALSVSASWEGSDYMMLVNRLLSAALRRYGPPPFREIRKQSFALPTGPIDLLIPEKVHCPPASTLELATLLDVRQGDRVLDLGCGSGLLSITAARLGAEHVIATDINPRALASTEMNAIANSVADKIEIRPGAWYEAIEGIQGPIFDLIIATPPQTPGHYAFGPRYGGWDGAKHLIKVIQSAPAFLKPENGRLWLLAISLANLPEVMKQLQKRFGKVSVVRETERPFTGPEYEFIAKGLMRHLLKLRTSGVSDFRNDDAGEYVFRNLFICASEVKP